MANTADVLPPSADRLNCEGRRVVVDPDADPARVGGQIINSIIPKAPVPDSRGIPPSFADSLDGTEDSRHADDIINCLRRLAQTHLKARSDHLHRHARLGHIGQTP